MDRVMKALDDYEESAGLHAHIPPGEETELQEYFVLDRRSIEAMLPKEAASASVRLSAFAFYLQREVNREDTRVSWCTDQLDDVIAKELGQYDKYMKHEMKVSLIAQNNVYAGKVLRLKRYAEKRAQRLSFLASNTKHLSEAFQAVQRANWKPHNE
tara:strand:+ start:311 stop:778 length:468 start_codon:yes stop_codon:yes gene_type:complete